MADVAHGKVTEVFLAEEAGEGLDKLLDTRIQYLQAPSHPQRDN